MARVRRLFVLIFIAAMVSMTFMSCAPSEYKLSASSDPTAGGTVTPDSGTYDKGVGVDVVATPASGYRFDHWEGGASGDSPTLCLTMNGSKHLIAYFTKTYTVSISTTPSDGGSVSPDGGTYDEGEEVTLAATTTLYYKFSGWSGDALGISDQITITMDSDKTVVASFVKLTYSVQTLVDPSGGGTVEPGSGVFEAGTYIDITATPASGYRFDHWGGSATGTTNTLNMLVDGDKTVTAHFIKTWYTLSVSRNPYEFTIFTIDPSTSVYDPGTVVTLTAKAVFPYAFDHWSGTDNDAMNPTTVTMNEDKSVTAYARQLTPGPPHTKSGTYQGFFLQIPIPVNAGEWVQVAADSELNWSWQILDAEFAVLGFPSIFQAQTSGNYYAEIIYYGLGWQGKGWYELTYTIYS